MCLGKGPRRRPTSAASRDKVGGEDKATIRGFCWRPRDADHTATGKRPFPRIPDRGRLPRSAHGRLWMRRRQFIAGLAGAAAWPTGVQGFVSTGGNAMATLGRRSFLKSATLMTAGGIVTNSAAVLSTSPSLGQGVPGNSQYGVKALFFDMFGTVLDWRTGVARSVEATLKPRGYSLDWLAFADVGAQSTTREWRKSVPAAFRTRS
jgi:hypothetical protein